MPSITSTTHHTAHTLQFMAIGDWGASYESNDCAGTLMVQQKADATAMVGGWCLSDTLHHMCALPKNAHLYNMDRAMESVSDTMYSPSPAASDSAQTARVVAALNAV